jgi:uncharacterized protein YecT (DUF1311 family)
MAKRKIVDEILSVRLRSEISPRWGGATLRLLALEVELDKASERDSEMLKYFPIALVAIFESYFRSAICELIEFGSPFLENAAKFSQDKMQKPDFEWVLAIERKKITLGELIAHLLPFHSLEDVDCNMSTVIGESFLERIKATRDRWAVEIDGASPKPILDSPADVYQAVKETFRLRHEYCHELGLHQKPDKTLISNCYENSSLLLKAADQLIWDLVAPNAPLTQSAMNKRAHDDLTNADRSLIELCKKIDPFLDDMEKKEFKESHAIWAQFRDKEAESVANRWGRGGTIWPTLRAGHAHKLTLLRIEELKRELQRIEKLRPAVASASRDADRKT